MNWLLKISAIIALILMFSIAWNEHSEYKQFKSVGYSARAYLLGEVSESTQRRGRIKHTDYSADLSFTTADGQLVEIHRVLPEETFAAIQAGNPVEILYLPHDPKKIRFSQQSDQSLSIALGGILLFALLYIFGSLKTKQQE